MAWNLNTVSNEGAYRCLANPSWLICCEGPEPGGPTGYGEGPKWMVDVVGGRKGVILWIAI